MPNDNIKTVYSPLTKVFSADSTAADSITPPVPTPMQPAGDGIINWRTADGLVGNILALMFFGVGSNGQTATARVTAWRQINVGGVQLWIPTPLLALALTFGSQTGVATAPVTNAENFVTSITASPAFTSAYEIISPGDGTVAAVKVDAFGSDLIQVQVATGNNTSTNALWDQF